MLAFVLLTSAAIIVIFGLLLLWLGRRGLIIRQPWRPSGRRAVSLLTESLSYLGVTFALAAVGVALAESWDVLAPWERAAVVGAIAVVSAAVGLVLHANGDPVVQRFVGFTLLLSTAAAAATVAMTLAGVAGQGATATALGTGSTVAVYSAVLWGVGRRESQLAALFTGLIATICAFVPAVTGAVHPWLTIPLGLWMLGVGWAVLGWRYPDPLWTSRPLGTAVALSAPAIAIWRYDLMLAVGVITAAAVMTVCVRSRDRVLLAFGTVAEFGYLTATMILFFREFLDLALVLAISGGLLIVLAVASALLRRTANSRRTGGTRPTRFRPRTHLP